MVGRVVLILLLSLSASGIQAATIRAHLDRNPVTVNESFLLSFDVQGDADGEADFSPLEALFDILSRSQGSQIQIINGELVLVPTEFAGQGKLVRIRPDPLH